MPTGIVMSGGPIFVGKNRRTHDGWLQHQEGSLLTSTTLIGPLDRAMIKAGLWAPSGYPPVNGGVVLLIALVLCTAHWWASPLKPKKGFSRRFLPSIAAVCGMAITVIAFFTLVLALENSTGINQPFGLAKPLLAATLGVTGQVRAPGLLGCRARP